MVVLQVQNVADEGAVGVIVYWDPADASDNPDTPSNISYIPYAAAAIYTTGTSVDTAIKLFITDNRG